MKQAVCVGLPPICIFCNGEISRLTLGGRDSGAAQVGRLVRTANTDIRREDGRNAPGTSDEEPWRVRKSANVRSFFAHPGGPRRGAPNFSACCRAVQTSPVIGLE